MLLEGVFNKLWILFNTAYEGNYCNMIFICLNVFLEQKSKKHLETKQKMNNFTKKIRIQTKLLSSLVSSFTKLLSSLAKLLSSLGQAAEQFDETAEQFGPNCWAFSANMLVCLVLVGSKLCCFGLGLLLIYIYIYIYICCVGCFVFNKKTQH